MSECKGEREKRERERKKERDNYKEKKKNKIILANKEREILKKGKREQLNIISMFIILSLYLYT